MSRARTPPRSGRAHCRADGGVEGPVPVNFIDIVVLVVIGISALIAVSSGFVNVVLWILSWVGAVAATIFFFPTARPIADKYISEPLIANVVTGVAIFVVALFVCAILNQIISRIVRG